LQTPFGSGHERSGCIQFLVTEHLEAVGHAGFAVFFRQMLKEQPKHGRHSFSASRPNHRS
jgi:hypothetical protein